MLCNCWCNKPIQKILTTKIILVLRHAVWPYYKIYRIISKFGWTMFDDQLLYPALIMYLSLIINSFIQPQYLCLSWFSGICVGHFFSIRDQLIVLCLQKFQFLLTSVFLVFQSIQPLDCLTHLLVQFSDSSL